MHNGNYLVRAGDAEDFLREMVDAVVPVDDAPSISVNPPQIGDREDSLCEQADGTAPSIDGPSTAENPQHA